MMLIKNSVKKKQTRRPNNNDDDDDNNNNEPEDNLRIPCPINRQQNNEKMTTNGYC